MLWQKHWQYGTGTGCIIFFPLYVSGQKFGFISIIDSQKFIFIGSCKSFPPSLLPFLPVHTHSLHSFSSPVNNHWVYYVSFICMCYYIMYYFCLYECIFGFCFKFLKFQNSSRFTEFQNSSIYKKKKMAKIVKRIPMYPIPVPVSLLLTFYIIMVHLPQFEPILTHYS